MWTKIYLFLKKFNGSQLVAKFVIMIRTFKYRMYPTKTQAAFIDNRLNLCRWLHNTAIEHRIISFKAGKSTSYKEQANQLPEIKDAYPEFKAIHSQVLQDVLKRVDKSFKAFFRRCKFGEKPGFPRFKGKDRFHSITYPQSGFVMNGSRIYLSSIGKVKLRVHRDMIAGAKIKTCTVKKNGNHWYCSLTFETSKISVPKKIVSSAIGIDLGLENFATLSNGETIGNPRHLRKSEDRLKEIQSEYSIRKTKTTKQKLIKLHRKIANQRTDFLHKESTKLINSFDMVAYEDLNIKAMVNGRYSKGIHDAGWGKFIAMIEYKAESASTYAIPVNPYHTSQICSGCGTLVKKEIHQRFHNCPICSLSIHRDLNAAINILKSGTDSLLKMLRQLAAG